MIHQKGPVSRTVVLIFLSATVLTNAIGNVCLSHGMKAVGLAGPIHVASLGHTLARAVHHPAVWWGLGLLLIFFAGFLLLLSWADLSFVLPLLSISYVVNIILARYILHETVPVTRWLGVLAICAGAYYVSTTLESSAVTPPASRPSADTL